MKVKNSLLAALVFSGLVLTLTTGQTFADGKEGGGKSSCSNSKKGNSKGGDNSDDNRALAGTVAITAPGTNTTAVSAVDVTVGYTIANATGATLTLVQDGVPISVYTIPAPLVGGVYTFAGVTLASVTTGSTVFEAVLTLTSSGGSSGSSKCSKGGNDHGNDDEEDDDGGSAVSTLVVTSAPITVIVVSATPPPA